MYEFVRVYWSFLVLQDAATLSYAIINKLPFPISWTRNIVIMFMWLYDGEPWYWNCISHRQRKDNVGTMFTNKRHTSRCDTCANSPFHNNVFLLINCHNHNNDNNTSNNNINNNNNICYNNNIIIIAVVCKVRSRVKWSR